MVFKEVVIRNTFSPPLLKIWLHRRTPNLAEERLTAVGQLLPHGPSQSHEVDIIVPI